MRLDPAKNMRVDWPPSPDASGSSLVLQAAVIDRYGAEDAVVKERLDFIVKVLGRCKFCRKKLHDSRLARAPGICWKCQRAAKRLGSIK